MNLEEIVAGRAIRKENIKHTDKIMLITDFSEKSVYAQEHAILIAKALKRDICLVYLSDIKLKGDFSQKIDMKLAEISAIIKNKYGITVDAYNMQSVKYKTINQIAERLSCVLILAPDNTSIKKPWFIFPNKLKIFRKCRAAFIMVNHPPISNKIYSSIGIAVNDSREVKEMIQMASYFGRSNNSEIVLVMPNDKDAHIQSKILANVKFAEKIFTEFEVSYRKEIINAKSYNVHLKIYKNAEAIGVDSIMLITTGYLNVFESFGGPDEAKQIKNKETLSSICLNPRDDLYILCQ